MKIGLLTSAAAPDRAVNFVADLTGELTVGGYSRKTLASKTVTESDGANRIEFDAADALFAALAAGETVGWAFLYGEVTNDADSPVLCLLDLANTLTNGGDLTVQFSAAGCFTLNTA